MLIRQVQLDNFYPDRHLRLSGLEQGLHVVYATDPQVLRALMGAIPTILFGTVDQGKREEPDRELKDDAPRSCLGHLQLQNANPRRPGDKTEEHVTIELHQCGGLEAPAIPQIVSADGTPHAPTALARLQAGLTRAHYFDRLFLTHSTWEAIQDPTQATEILDPHAPRLWRADTAAYQAGGTYGNRDRIDCRAGLGAV